MFLIAMKSFSFVTLSAANAGLPSSDPASIALTVTGQEQALALPPKISGIPDLIVVSNYLRTHETAMPLLEAYAHGAACEIWPYTYENIVLAPSKYVNTTTKYRKPFVDEYWEKCDPEYQDGEEAESFVTFIARVQRFVAELTTRRENRIVVIGHGRFFQAVIWCMQNNNFAPTKEMMLAFRKFCKSNPIENTQIIKIRP